MATRVAHATRSDRTDPATGWARSASITGRVELRRALRRRRLFMFNVIVPLLLVAPIAFGGAPRQHAAIVFAVLFVFFGTFGSAIPALRDAERGIVRRVCLTPLHAGAALAARALAGAAIDFVQLLPALLVAGFALVPAGRVPLLALALLATLAFSGLLGTWIAAIARSVAEGALFAAVSALLLLHASGVFRTPTPGSTGASVEAASPFRLLHESMLAGQPAGAAALAAALGSAILLTLLAGRRLMRSLATADGRGT